MRIDEKSSALMMLLIMLLLWRFAWVISYTSRFHLRSSAQPRHYSRWTSYYFDVAIRMHTAKVVHVCNNNQPTKQTIQDRKRVLLGEESGHLWWRTQLFEGGSTHSSSSSSSSFSSPVFFLPPAQLPTNRNTMNCYYSSFLPLSLIFHNALLPPSLRAAI